MSESAEAVAREDVKALAAEIVARLESKSDHMYQWPRWAAADEAAEAVLSSSWLAAHDEKVRAAERERHAAEEGRT
jgi:hypothetical protein